MSQWTINDARATYNLQAWSEGYVDIDAQGNLLVRPDPDNPVSVNLPELVSRLPAAGVRLPVLVRFSGILRHRVRLLQQAFAAAMETHRYQGRYTPVYPIKVNQQHSVVQALMQESGDSLGLEAGSKPELLAVIASSHEDGIIVCNGYKDREYIRLALIARDMGMQVFLVIEKVSELVLVLEESRSLGITPLLGVRVRLASIAAGNWQNSGGAKSKFGLSAAQMMKVVATLKDAGLLHALSMMHFHMGSQITELEAISQGATEAGRYLGVLSQQGVVLTHVNAGGGLGIDYEGTQSRSFCSRNYSIEQYADVLVAAFKSAAEKYGVSCPDIITESGRAMSAHHAMLITNVIDREVLGDGVVSQALSDAVSISTLQQFVRELENGSPVNLYHDAAQLYEKSHQLFLQGQLELQHLAQFDELYFSFCRQLQARLTPQKHSHRQAWDSLNDLLADKYFVNFSLFQSAPDHWAIDQVFPVMPIHRLNEKPDRRVRLQDITCDSDGSMHLYVDSEGVESTLPLHSISDDNEYLLGFFLLGAYQEILGDMHNLFGDTDSVHVEINEQGEFKLTEIRHGDSVEQVLDTVHFEKNHLINAFIQKVAQARSASDDRRAEYLRMLSEGLQGYTYLE
ncbi:MAG: arginine decarboxylase [Gammaproteobacteria bacterium]|nr:MAG: arginine decarboxylase [Gammaproteobacteria bacterium]